MKYLSLLSLVFLLSFAACKESKNTENQSNTDSTAQANAEKPASDTPQEIHKVRYRCDGFYPGIASEWIEATYTDTKLTAMEYWNTQDETRKTLKILSVDYGNPEAEISGISGELEFPGIKGKVGFGGIEDKLNLIFDGDRFQEFEYEPEIGH